METFLYITFFISCIVLVGTVLLQPGKTDAGALFTSGVSNTSTNPRGTASVLSKITIGAAATFMLTALMLSLPAITGNRSVLSTQGAPDSSSATTTNTNSENANTSEANTASNAATETKVEEKKGDEAKPEETKEEKKEESSEEKKSDEKKDDKTDGKKSEDK